MVGRLQVRRIHLLSLCQKAFCTFQNSVEPENALTGPLSAVVYVAWQVHEVLGMAEIP